MKRDWVHYATRVVTVNLVILVVGAVVLELVFGNWFTPNRMNRLNIPRDAVSYVDVSPLYPSPGGLVKYSRDRYGFRGTYGSVDSIDILTIGGSTTDQRNIADGKTWQDVLAHAFLEHGARVSVVNAGVDGQSAYGHLKNFDWWFPFVPHLKVRYFLFYVGLNDFYKDEGYVNDRLVKPSSALKALLEENSAVYQIYRTLFGMYQASMVAKLSHRGIRFSTLEWTSAPRLADHDGPIQHRLQAYRQRLLALGERSARLDGRVICVTQPSRAYKKVDGSIVGVAKLGSYDGLPFNGVDYYYMIQRFHQMTLQTCREMGGLGIDLANEVEWDDEDFYDFSHSTPRGAEKIGRHLYTKLHGYEAPRQAIAPLPGAPRDPR